MSNDVDRARTRRSRAATRKANQAREAREERKRAAEAGEALDNYDETFLECRDLHHPWRVLGFYRVGAEIRRRLICSRCSTEATDVWRPNGERIKRGYKYVEGYNIKGGGVTPFDVRREVLARVTVYDNEANMVNALFNGRGRRRTA